MKEKIKSFLLGVVTTILVSGVITAFAATIDVEIGGIRIFWDGEEKTLTDVNGDKVEPMIYNGTTYVPVRAMSELMGKTVEWDEAAAAVYVGGKPEGVAVVNVNGTEITDVDLSYYIYAQASSYAQQNGITFDRLSDFDWNRITDGFPLSDKIRSEAVDAAVNDILVIQKGASNNVALEENEKSAIKTQVSALRDTYGEEGFTLRIRTMGIPSVNQYEKMYINTMTVQKVQADISANSGTYYPEDLSVLNHYVQPDGATVKHILIAANDTNKAEKRRVAENVLRRAQSGEDFDKLAEEYNEDPGAAPEGYTFGPGEMVKEFEEASFALGLGGMSGIVETAYGFHIIKRIPGLYELQAYWQAESGNNISISQDMVSSLDVNAIMTDVINATNELSNQQ